MSRSNNSQIISILIGKTPLLSWWGGVLKWGFEEGSFKLDVESLLYWFGQRFGSVGTKNTRLSL